MKDEQGGGAAGDVACGGETQSRVFRVGVSVAAGVVVLVAALATVWLQCRDAWRLYPSEQHDTVWRLWELEQAIDQHRERTGELPDSLTELTDLEDGLLALDAAGRPLDGWGHPYRYKSLGYGYELWSDGRDGRLGGVGLDAAVHRIPRGGVRWSGGTFSEFFEHAVQPGMILACVAGACLASAACYRSMRRRASGKMGVFTMVLKVVVTIIACLIVAGVMAFWHAMPVLSGH